MAGASPPRGRGNSGAALLLAPASLILMGGFLLPLADLGAQSLRQFTPGRVGVVADAPFTFDNYRELLNGAFADVLLTTFWIGVLAAAISLIIAFPLAYAIVRRFRPRWRTFSIGVMITLVLSSILVKTYAIELTFGSVGITRPLLLWLGVAPNGRATIEAVVIAGLVHAIVPVAVLTLIGAVQSIDPRLADAAQSLGAPAWKAHLTITLPLARVALSSSFLVSLTFAISAFVIPMVLGRGRVLFMSNIIYTRFSDIANYPSGAAVSLAMLAASMLVISGVSIAHARSART
jgi:putative spermidine/putrescine transport system permease protein